MTTHKRALFTLLLASVSPYQAFTFTFAKTNAAAASSAFTHISKPESSSNANALEGAAAASCHHDDARGEGSSRTQLCAAATSMEEDAAAVMTMISKDNLSLCSDRGRHALEQLMDLGDESQVHVYGGWPEVGVEDENKVKLSEQLADLNDSYPGGLHAYLTKAKALLKESAAGTNPFDEYIASVPSGESLTYDAKDDVDGGLTFAEAEELGLRTVSNVAFVLVAGGLGERLGYSGIKLSLSTNLLSEWSYLELYAKYILAMQQQNESKVEIPLVIMTSGDTDAPTRALLKENKNFGLSDSQVQIVVQDKVPALKDGSAGLSLSKDDRWTVETKPHGHGDVHHLLKKSGLVDKWLEENRSHVIFLQDTNALVINGILATLGVSVANDFHMNSICIPRLAGEAAGAITQLEHKTDTNKNLVINVEYNQLDPLLRTQGAGDGDVADEATGYSPYPGNANNLVMELKSYHKTISGEDEGVVLEFVNPKYKDETKTTFKKATRLECMMQDFPKLLQKEMGSEAKVGFTQFERWLSFSPAKNSLESGQESVEKSGKQAAPGTLSSAESDMYLQNQRKLRSAGVDIPESDLVLHSGIYVTSGPRIILSPSFAMTQREIEEKITRGASSISTRSSLVLDGSGINVESMNLDGALVVTAAEGCKVTIRGLNVANDGWDFIDVSEEDMKSGDVPEEISIRGYTLDKKDTTEYHVTEPGEYVIGEDGKLTKL
eukprot:CAMPEP_0116068674 /NCGR_PEP_ID=MMETSP0322-20121206/11812_1 /TAXON_ID=163516 /ORGANISM="Leptocylindrus danicus var. apora, Strain B651" /LENGTH=721 /DNA_ID=CAMNT_0003555851 /DNA_START=60 /DNA_END=2225 /DNA_ORIENTATION=-